MARYKPIDTSPRFLAVDLEKQLLPGSLAYAVNHLLDHDFDLSGFDARYRNDAAGARAYPPGMLLKVILCAYAEGVVSSRGIERLCREHVSFIALSGDPAPHFTTLAAFVSSLGEDVTQLFAQVLYLCDKQGLIGRQMFAIDGVKLPSNASKSKSGTRAQAKPDTLYTADAGYHSEANLKALAGQHIDALIADNGMRQRDERFKDQARHKAKPDPLHDKSKSKAKIAKPSQRYKPSDFNWNAEAGTCICPAGKSLYQNGAHCQINGRLFTKFTGAQRDCGPCTQRDQCLRHPDKTLVRQVCFSRGKVDPAAESFTDKMKRAIDSEEGRQRYGQRFATVEPVFGNLRHNKRLNRFTLRGQQKVDTQWKLYCLVHNIEKLAHHGYGQ